MLDPRKEYVCPKCGEEDKTYVVDSDGFDNIIAHYWECGECGAEWNEYYEMVRITEVEDNEN